MPTTTPTEQWIHSFDFFGGAVELDDGSVFYPSEDAIEVWHDGPRIGGFTPLGHGFKILY